MSCPEVSAALSSCVQQQGSSLDMGVQVELLLAGQPANQLQETPKPAAETLCLPRSGPFPLHTVSCHLRARKRARLAGESPVAVWWQNGVPQSMQRAACVCSWSARSLPVSGLCTSL